ncbi:hypothetical protein GCM10018772_41300 [Streptomyces fumanus]|uniref:Uncharacterized protein n=1 Tax=Streptomyces fumanus TaxID=67302 RepID=A0A919AK32_9ACTN|nr:hypothetical protein GCM10018772_41300 [Streptomyces fumanus]
MSEGYEGKAVTGRGRPAGGTGRAADHAEIPFLGHRFRVSGLLRDELHARRAVADGWIRHA